MSSTVESDAGEQDEPGSSSPPDPHIAPSHPQTPASSDPTPDASPVPDVTVAVMPGVTDAVDTDWIEAKLLAALAHIPHHAVRVSVLIVNDDLMSRLHHRHLGKAQTTDVLTFPASREPGPIDADIAVCIDRARRQSRQRGFPLRRELLLYAVHGLLHCAGFDDHLPDAERAMHREEDRILTAIGVGATFSPPNPGPDAPSAEGSLHKDLSG